MARFEPRTGLRGGDLVRVWPYEGDLLETVRGTESDGDDEPVWVLLEGASAVRADRVRLAAYGCPICGFCAGPRVDNPVVRPCPPCLVDLRRLERRASEADRIRRAIEARARRASPRRRRSATAACSTAPASAGAGCAGCARPGPDDLYAALLSAFTRAFERWHAPAA